MRVYVGITCLLLLAGCSVPSNPERGPVILLCQGQEVLRAANGEVERAHLRRFYRLDGKRQTVGKWDDKTQSFSDLRGLTVSPTQLVHSYDGHLTVGGISTVTTITFDRVTGRVTDEFAMSNGGTITFDASCKPVKSPTSETKF